MESLDAYYAIQDASGAIIAGAGIAGDVIKCLAVDQEYRSEGLLVPLVSRILALRGGAPAKVFTKPEYQDVFESMGFQLLASSPLAILLENGRGLQMYCDYLRAQALPGRCGVVVMNANPFTLGHRHLIEHAAAENDALHLFLLSEEAGPIPFAVRKRLVREGVADLPNVILHDSGPYIISSATFPSYFLRDEDAAILAHAKLDLAVFGKIAAALGLTARYAGEEKSSHVTALYNETMAAELPKLGLAFRPIPRLAIQGETVSASSVRQAIHDGELEKAAFMLPESSLRYFESEEAAPVIAAIRAMDEARHY